MLSVLQKLKEQGILSQGDYYFAKLIADKQCHTDYAEPVKNLAILLAALCSWRYTQGNTCSQLDRYLEHNLFGLAYRTTEEDYLAEIREKIGLEICCSLGLLTYEQALQLKEVGVTRYHSNIETAPSHFPDICTTHSYEDKMFTIDNAKKAGIRVCSGGILGLNETLEQRVEMAFELKRLNIDSIPLNILNPIKGTPFEDNKALKPMEILRTFAVFRFILPKALIRTAGGREVNLRDLQSYALKGGLNGIMVGGYLTTGGRSPQDDLQMIDDLELTRTAVQL